MGLGKITTPDSNKHTLLINTKAIFDD